MKQFLYRLWLKLKNMKDKKTPLPPPKDTAGESLDDPKWIVIAKQELGVSEWLKGKNPRISEYHAASGHPQYDQNTSWCSSFMCWVIEKAGFLSTNSAQAQSWLKSVGCEKLDKPKYGCIVIFDRPSTSAKWDGHVTFWIGEDANYVYCLGGNQKNSVCYSKYPKKDVLGYRWPK